MKRAITIFAFAALVAATTSAGAQEDPAGAKFEAGLAAMKAEKWDVACPALAESYRLDPRAGVVFTLAECEAKWGKLATSLAHYQAYLDAYSKLKPEEQSRQGRRAEIAQSQKIALEQDVPRLTIKLRMGAPPGASVVLDGVGFDLTKIGTAVPLDPGDHAVVYNAPDGTSEPKKITLAVRESRTIELGPPSAKSGTGAPDTKEKEKDTVSTDGSGPSRVPLVAAISVAVIGIGVGSATGLIAAGKKSTIDEHCIDTKCDATGKQAGDDAKSMATISTIAFGVGIAATAAAVVLLIVAPSSKPAAAKKRIIPDVAVGTNGATFGLGGSF